MPINSNVSSVSVAAGATVQLAPADNQRTYLRAYNSSLADICISISQAAAAAQKGYRSTGQQSDFVLSDEETGQLVQQQFWVFNNSSTTANVAVVQGYRV